MTGLRRLATQRDLMVAAVYVIACVAALFVPVPLVRAIVVVPLVLFVPGYALVSALFPLLVVPTVERVLMAIGASLGVTIIVGLVLSFAGIALTPVSWLAALAGVSIGGITAAALRRTRSGVDGPRLGLATMPRRGALAVLIALLVVGNVVVGSRIVAGDQQQTPPLQLWMLPIEGRPLSAELGVQADDTGGRYAIVVSSAGSIVAQYNPFLRPNETWQTVVAFTPEVRSRPIVARLYEPGAAVESRFVVMQPVTGGG